MGTILCCVDDKKQDYIQGKEDSEKRQFQEDDNNIKMVFKHPQADKHEHKQEGNFNNNSEIKENHQENQLGLQAVEQFVQDNLEEFQYDFGQNPQVEEGNREDSDQEQEDISQLKNEFEQDLRFSKRGIIQYINDHFAFEDSESEIPKWELKLNKEDIKVSIKKGGSRINQKEPYIRTQIYFNPYFKMEKIIKSIFNKDIRLLWDKNAVSIECQQLSRNHSVISHVTSKAPLNFSNRDFVDKQMRFADNGTFYVFYSHIPNNEQTHPVPNKVERGTTLIGIQKIERRQSDGKIVYTMYMQGDFKMNITPKIISMFLPTGMQDWFKKANKYLNDNYDKI